MTSLEEIVDGATTLAYLIRHEATSNKTEFFTSDDSNFQAGFVVYPAGGHVQAHVHLPVVRQVVGTSELLVVRSGRCIVDIYTDDRRLVASREMLPGDAVLSVSGGHGFRMTEQTVLFEIKQGPYGGQAEKERFDTAPEGEPA
ncbi:MAG TPA: hypothetical protein VIK31_08580 [Propionibacteriaceae bacterium]|jgi:mannose-6-phosphate isomerase-like protein (cupin superfamily)